jgi:hypothetical protein
VFDQFAADFEVERQRCPRTHLGEPLSIDLVGQHSKAEYRDIDSVCFTAGWIFDEITPASGAMTLYERIAGLDFNLASAGAGPPMAAPYGAIHKRPPVAEACDASM